MIAIIFSLLISNAFSRGGTEVGDGGLIDNQRAFRILNKIKRKLKYIKHSNNPHLGKVDKSLKDFLFTSVTLEQDTRKDHSLVGHYTYIDRLIDLAAPSTIEKIQYEKCKVIEDKKVRKKDGCAFYKRQKIILSNNILKRSAANIEAFLFHELGHLLGYKDHDHLDSLGVIFSEIQMGKNVETWNVFKNKALDIKGLKFAAYLKKTSFRYRGMFSQKRADIFCKYYGYKKSSDYKVSTRSTDKVYSITPRTNEVKARSKGQAYYFVMVACLKDS